MTESNIFSEAVREWNQAVLTGNVNGLHYYPALLEQVQDIGGHLQSLGADMEKELLISQDNLHLTMLSMKAQNATDLLHRGLFERTADVGAMASNAQIREYLKKGALNQADRDDLQTLLENYVFEYSVYDDVIILTPDGHRFASLKGEDSMHLAQTHIVHEALKKSDYTEYFTLTPLPVLLYLQPILNETGHALGLMVLSFQFQYEMQHEIFPDVLDGHDDLTLLLITPENKIAASSSDRFTIGSPLPASSDHKITLQEAPYYICIQETNGYEGYMGFGLKGCAIKPVRKESKRSKKQSQRRKAEFVPKNLRRIISNVDDVETDLHIVGLNGKLKAGREEDKTLPPILDGIRDAGAKIRFKFQDVIVDLVDDLEIILSQKVESISKMSMIVVDHNLYERANDVCWWADGKDYRETLNHGTISASDRSKLNQLLSETNALYTVYEHLFIFDQNAIVQACSKQNWASKLIGQKIETPEINDVLNNGNPKKYFVSKFEKSALYNGRNTYIYYATIFAPDTDTPIGGIGLVFDSYVQFQTMLEECLASETRDADEEQPIGVLYNHSKTIISSTSELFQVGEKFNEKTIDENRYFIHETASVGYREYLRTDGHSIDKKCWIAIPKA